MYKNLSLCLVVANSSDCIPRFMSWALPRFDDIIILKSDSDDNTDDLLDRYASNNKSISLYHQPIQNIAHQKQTCLDYSNKKYKLIIDADEIVQEANWDNIVEQMNRQSIDLLYLPRFNLQKDHFHYLPDAYPDWQPRLLSSSVSFNLDPLYETHHTMQGQRNQSVLSQTHIIHWGHIRSEQQMQWKSNMRKQYASTDLCDGKGLVTTENWYHERNTILGYDDKAQKLSQNIIEYIQSIEGSAT